MILALTQPESALIVALTAPVLYLASVALGRALKRRAGVRLGVMYQLFCIVISLYFPLRLLSIPITFPVDMAPGKVPIFDASRELGAAAVLLAALFLIALIRRYLWEIYFAQRRQMEIPKFLREVVALLIFLLALVLVLRVGYGQSVTGVLLPSTVIVGIIGWAMQDLLGNLIAGVSLQLGKPFKSGDWLIVESRHAEVIEVNWRSTRLRTNDDHYLDIPNSQIVKSTVINLSYPTKLHAMRLRVGVDYDVAPNVVKAALAHATIEAKGVLITPAPKIYLIDFGDSAIIYEIKFWLEDHAKFNDITDAIRTNIWYELQRAKIKIPFPIRTLQFEAEQPRKRELSEFTRQSLRKKPFFQCLDEQQTDSLISEADLCWFGRDEKIIEQGADGDSMFVLVRGSAEVYVQRNGHPAMVATLGSGDYFGEMSLLTGEKRSATIIASTDCEVLRIEKPIIAPLLQNNSTLMQRLSEMLAQRRIENESKLASTVEKRALDIKKAEYERNFFDRVRAFFEL
jgi:small-conductance mechanosensitive channel/CRP-like cAMP-binding protein